jgi:hypothetical protein
MAKGEKRKKAKVKERQERRFLPLPAASATVANAFGGLSAAALGAGVFAQFGHAWLDDPAPPYAFAPGLIAGGAVAFAVAIWLGTSGEAVLRVGSGGVGIERAKDVVRVPWHRVERIVWDPDHAALTVDGKDEAGRAQHVVLSPKVHPAAIGWIVKEARGRIPLSVDVPDEAHGLPVAQLGDGELLTMDAIQVVGQRCAESDRVIAYEPDARVCTRCERIYYRTAVPDACACGASLEALKGGAKAEKTNAEKPEAVASDAGKGEEAPKAEEA